MRYTYPIFALLCAAVLFLSTTKEESPRALFSFLDEEEVPDLPDIPYDYGEIRVPDHLVLTKHGRANSNGFGMLTNEGITLGRVLFYDEQLSANENISCASCHDQALSFAESTPFSEGVNEDTKRNAMHLNDIAWSNNMGFFWDLSGGDLEQMIALPLANENEIGITDEEGLIRKLEASSYYPELFADAFGSPLINMLRVQSALGLFMRSMTTFDSRYDQVQRGEAEFTPNEELGNKLFQADCSVCHTDGNNREISLKEYPQSLTFIPNLFDNLMDTGDDIGAGSWSQVMMGKFKAPTLRNIELTAPYMHDGRFETIEEVLEHYSTEVEDAPPSPWNIDRIPDGGFKYTDQEKIALTAFLKTLTDRTITEDVRWSDPFGKTTVATEDLAPMAANAVEIYPNPSNGLTQISFDNTTGHKIEAQLINMEGRLVRKLSTHKSGLVTDVSQLPAGMYLVRIRRGNTYLDKKLIVQ